MSDNNIRSSSLAVVALGVCVLPLIGVRLWGGELGIYFEFPPLTKYVQHAGFSWVVFVAMAVSIAAVTLPVIIRWGRTVNLRGDSCPESRFPAWGWIFVTLTFLSWLLSWSRFEWFMEFQIFSFTPLWIGYIGVVNALTYRRTNSCMMLNRTRYFIMLFVFSAIFWWFFEYLNRFVQNWYYVGIGDLSASEYSLFATLAFSTVLPAVMSTYELLEAYPGISQGFTHFIRVPQLPKRSISLAMLALSAMGLVLLKPYSDYLYPLLWISPLMIITSLQSLSGSTTIFSPLAQGNWRRVVLLAISALICGFFWEMWNYYSYARWIYSIPFVQRFHIFEMPILGYAGYLPFGLECAVVADIGRQIMDRVTAKTFVRICKLVLSFIIAAAIWLPVIHLLYSPDISGYYSEKGIAPKTRKLLNFQLKTWEDSKLKRRELDKMRSRNAEWDFMGRTYLVLALSNAALRVPADKQRYLEVIDTIIEETIRLEKENGIYYFLMDYAKYGEFINRERRSIFVDGEIALMLAVRQLVEIKEDYRPLLKLRCNLIADALDASPAMLAESYPNECWLFCNSVAVSALAIAEAVDNSEYSGVIDRWLKVIKERFIDRKTGILISSTEYDGTVTQGPEGSSVWMILHCLELVDPQFARTQYGLAKQELSQSFLGFGYAKEWPASWDGRADIDSGPIIPLFEASAGSSGLAILGAATFVDLDYQEQLITSLNYAAFPSETGTILRYNASNQVGDAVMLYAFLQGPLWKIVKELRGSKR